MPEDQLSLEQRVRSLEDALAAAHRRLEQLAAARRSSLRSRRFATGTLLTAAMGSVLIGASRISPPSAMQGPQPLTVRAPFEVVDEAGREIVVVSTEQGARGLAVYNDFEKNEVVFLGRDETNFSGISVANRAGVKVAELGQSTNGYPGLYVYNAAQKEVASVSTSLDEGGLVTAMNQGGSEQAQLKIRDDMAGFIYIKAGKPVINLGRGEKGNLALRIKSGENTVAGIGESADGTGGALALQDAAGKDAVKAGIASGEGGQVVVTGTGGGRAGIATKGAVGSFFAGPIEAPIAKLGESETNAGAGVLQLGAPGGGSAVQAGFSQGGGIVETYTPGKPVGILKAGIKIPGFTAGSNQ